MSSSPPNQICEPLGSSAYQSVRSSRYVTFGNAVRMTVGNVSWTIEFLTWLNRKRRTACRLPGALRARMTMLRVSR